MVEDVAQQLVGEAQDAGGGGHVAGSRGVGVRIDRRTVGGKRRVWRAGSWGPAAKGRTAGGSGGQAVGAAMGGSWRGDADGVSLGGEV